jgi:hypothetical protein
MRNLGVVEDLRFDLLQSPELGEPCAACVDSDSQRLYVASSALFLACYKLDDHMQASAAVAAPWAGMRRVAHTP